MEVTTVTKHVMLLASYAPSLINFRGPLLQKLLGAGHVVSVCAPNISDSVRKYLEDLGVSVHEISMERNAVSVLADIRYYHELGHLMRRSQPDIVLTYTIKPNIWGGLAAKRAKVLSFSLVTGLGFAFSGSQQTSRFKDKVTGYLARKLYSVATRCNEAVIFQNPDDRDDFVSSGCLDNVSKAAVVAGSGVDLEHYARTDTVSAPIFLMISRLLTSKGIFEYAAAAKKLRASNAEVRCLLVGPYDGGADAISPQQLALWVNSGSLEYLGPADDVRPYIAQAAVYVLPSYREGTPRSVLEAMAMGRPIVTTDTPGCRETVMDGENGYLVPAQDSEKLADAMQRFVDNPLLIELMGSKAYQLAREKYDVHKVNRDMMKIMGLL